jgi:hypothetical protein
MDGSTGPSIAYTKVRDET